MNNRTKYLTTLAMLTAIGFTIGALLRFRFIPGAPFLTYDPKDVAILMGGFIYGPLAALTLSVTLALLEMVTISDSGPIGAVMNALASASFTCTAAFVYSRARNIKGAVIGLSLGIVATAVTMLAFNYVFVPLYMGHITREMVVGMILPILLPFNIIKPALNAAAALILYKHVTKALKAARLIPADNPADKNAGETNPQNLTKWVMPFAALVIVVLIVIIFLLNSH